MSRRVWVWLTSVVLVALFCVPSNIEAARGLDIADQVRALPNVLSVTERGSSIAGTRFFSIEYSQLIDHTHPETGTFVQRVTLLHRNEAKPVVLHLEGYYTNYFGASQREITAILARLPGSRATDLISTTPS